MTVKTVTRYERVQAILDGAVGESPSDYGGEGPFWHLSLPKLERFQLYGIPMIAPENAGAACPCCVSASSDGVKFPGRGAASGLVHGLRGEPPFDGTRFPPLPWGGQRVAEEDIAFISDWIDDGLPADDRETSFTAQGELADVQYEAVSANNVEESVRMFEVYDGSTNEYRYPYGEVKQRMNLDCLSDHQLEQLRGAFRELYNLNKWPEDIRSYNNMALIHQNHCQHGWERFLPWHRIYLYEFEQALQDVMPGVTMPYWDWTMPQYRPHEPEKGWIIPESYKAFLTPESLNYLQDAKPKLPKDQAEILRREMVEKKKLYTSTTTFFEAVADLIGEKPWTVEGHRDRFIDALLDANSLWYPLRYPSEYYKNGKPTPINVKIHYHYPTAEDMEEIMSLRTFRDFGGGNLYNDSFGFLDQNPHNTMHIWTGGENKNAPQPKAAAAGTVNRNRGVLVRGRRFHSRSDMYTQPSHGDMFSNLTASYDPVFWPIHVNIDRLWHEWQQTNPHSLPIDRDSVLTPWSYTIADTLNMSRFGYEYVKCSFIVPVGLSTPVGRFVSKPIAIPAAARGSFKQAEVRLHRVPQLPRSCFIRVFLNLPDANASTPIDHKNYAGYLSIFGHGECIGGPGHCDLPPSRPRPYDIRPRSHNTPRNHRVNVSKTARKLIDEGAKSLQVTLVVIGADYQEDNELLRVDGVSLDFLD